MIKNALVGVNKEGTAAGAFRKAAYVSGGKTGTAQVYSLKGEKYVAHRVDERLRDHAWFIAYARRTSRGSRFRAGGERRLRRAGRGADRAQGVRPLPDRRRRRRSRAALPAASEDDASD